jgi:hypothetical protein
MRQTVPAFFNDDCSDALNRREIAYDVKRPKTWSGVARHRRSARRMQLCTAGPRAYGTGTTPGERSNFNRLLGELLETEIPTQNTDERESRVGDGVVVVEHHRKTKWGGQD